MNNFYDLQELWQKQPIDQLSASHTTAALPELIQRLRTFERRQFRINLCKTLTVIVILAMLAFTLLQLPMQKIGLLGITIMFASTIAFLITYWQNQFGSIKLAMNAPSDALLSQAIVSLQAQKRVFQLHLPIFILALLLGLNLLYVDLLAAENTLYRLALHAGMSLFLILAAIIGKRFRMQRFAKEWQPLIDELETIQSDIRGEN